MIRTSMSLTYLHKISLEESCATEVNCVQCNALLFPIQYVVLLLY